MDNNEENFYRRMNQIGDYTYQNRMDTVFVFQLLFIGVAVIIGLFYLKSINIITPFFVYPMTILITIIILFIFINRIVLTNNIRSKTNWFQLNFGDGSISPSDYVSGGTNSGTKGLIHQRLSSDGCPSGQHRAPEQCVPN